MECFEKFGTKILKNWFNNILAGGRMLEERRESRCVLIYKNEEDIQNCRSYRGIKIMSTQRNYGKSIEKNALHQRRSVDLHQKEVPVLPMEFVHYINCLSNTEKTNQPLLCVFIDSEKVCMIECKEIRRRSAWEVQQYRKGANYWFKLCMKKVGYDT